MKSCWMCRCEMNKLREIVFMYRVITTVCWKLLEGLAAHASVSKFRLLIIIPSVCLYRSAIEAIATRTWRRLFWRNWRRLSSFSKFPPSCPVSRLYRLWCYFVWCSSELLDDGRWCPLWTPRAPSDFTQEMGGNRPRRRNNPSAQWNAGGGVVPTRF